MREDRGPHAYHRCHERREIPTVDAEILDLQELEDIDKLRDMGLLFLEHPYLQHREVCETNAPVDLEPPDTVELDYSLAKPGVIGRRSTKEPPTAFPLPQRPNFGPLSELPEVFYIHDSHQKTKDLQLQVWGPFYTI